MNEQTKNNEVLLRLLNLKNDDVESMFSSTTDNGILISLKLIRRTFECPHCKCKQIKVKGYYNVTIKNALVLDTKTLITLRQRRYICNECEKTFKESNPFTSGNRVTVSYRTEMNVLKALKNPSCTYSFAAKQNNISVSQVTRIFDKYVNYPRQTLPEICCIDEVYVCPSADYKYACVLYDFKNRKIIELIKSRRKNDLMNYFSAIPTAERDNVKVCSFDMWETYEYISHSFFKNCIQTCDSFHVIKEINTKLNQMRCNIMNRYGSQMKNKSLSKNDRDKAADNYYLLKTFNKLILSNYSNLKIVDGKYNHRLRRYLDTDGIINLILDLDPAFKAFYALKESYVSFNADENMTRSAAPNELDQIINSFQTAASKFDSLDCCLQIAKMLTRWRKYIINSFPENVGDIRVHNGVAESCNAVIKKVIVSSCGISRFDRFRNRILYCYDTRDRLSFISERQTLPPNIYTFQNTSN